MQAKPEAGTPETARVAALSGADLIAEAMRLAAINRLCGTDHTGAVLDRLAALLDNKG